MRAGSLPHLTPLCVSPPCPEATTERGEGREGGPPWLAPSLGARLPSGVMGTFWN